MGHPDRCECSQSLPLLEITKENKLNEIIGINAIKGLEMIPRKIELTLKLLTSQGEIRTETLVNRVHATAKHFYIAVVMLHDALDNAIEVYGLKKTKKT